MNRKVLLSFLGTSNYVSCNYFTEGNPEEKIENVRYIQEAIFKLYCTNFTANDQVLLLLTELAEKMNFLDDGQWSPQSKSYSASNEGLKSRFQQLQEEGFKFTLNTQRIKEGFSQEEIWSIFETIADQIQEGDTIILDITHAFRFLPMMGIVLLNYLKATKNITVAGIHYGAFEKLGPASEVRDLPEGERNAPILDLSTLLDFQSYTAAVSSFVKFGQVEELQELGKRDLNTILTREKGRNRVAQNLKSIINELDSLVSNLQTNRLPTIMESDYKIFFSNLEALDEVDFEVKPFKQIVNLIREKVNPIIQEKEYIWLKSAKWCLQHKLIQQAYTQLMEGILTLCIEKIIVEIEQCSEYGKNYERVLGTATLDKFHHDDRESIKKKILTPLALSKLRTKEGSLPSHKEALDYSLLETSFVGDLALILYNFGEIRNDINHAGFKKKRIKSKRLDSLIDEYIVKTEELIKEELIKKRVPDVT